MTAELGPDNNNENMRLLIVFSHNELGISNFMKSSIIILHHPPQPIYSDFHRGNVAKHMLPLFGSRVAFL